MVNILTLIGSYKLSSLNAVVAGRGPINLKHCLKTRGKLCKKLPTMPSAGVKNNFRSVGTHYKSSGTQSSARKAGFLNLTISMNRTYSQTRPYTPAHTRT